MNHRSTCPVSNALDFIGDRWSLLIVRDLFVGRTTYSEMLQMPEAIATNILVDRLKKLIELDIIVRTHAPNNNKTKYYHLTEKGIDLYPIICALSAWARTHAGQVEVHPLGLAQWNSFDQLGIEGNIKQVSSDYRNKREEFLTQA